MVDTQVCVWMRCAACLFVPGQYLGIQEPAAVCQSPVAWGKSSDQAVVFWRARAKVHIAHDDHVIWHGGGHLA